jgi:hypothetical protein
MARLGYLPFEGLDALPVEGVPQREEAYPDVFRRDGRELDLRMDHSRVLAPHPGATILLPTAIVSRKAVPICADFELAFAPPIPERTSIPSDIVLRTLAACLLP